MSQGVDVGSCLPKTAWPSDLCRSGGCPDRWRRPGFQIIATSENAPFAAIADEARKFYGVQFHPEVMHTPDGAKLLRNFALNIAGFKGDWTMHAFRAEEINPYGSNVKIPQDFTDWASLSSGSDPKGQPLLPGGVSIEELETEGQ